VAETLQEPVAVKIIQFDGGFAVSDQIVGVFGSGSTLAEATQDFARAMYEHYEVLVQQKALSPALVEQLDYVSRLTGNSARRS
jgi:hypothetical protein